MNSQELRALQEAYSQVYEQETGRGPRISDTYDMRDAEGGPKGGGTIKGPKRKNVIRKEETDLFDIILEYLVAEGYADTNEAATAIMANMSEDWRESITESLRDLLDPSKGVAARAQNQSPFAQPAQPFTQLPSNLPPSPFQKPNRLPGNRENRASSGDGGKLTTYGAGGGKAAEAGGMSYDQVVKQGAANLENKKRVQPKNQGPDFGR
jgi:hypothetical protein